LIFWIRLIVCRCFEVLGDKWATQPASDTSLTNHSVPLFSGNQFAPQTIFQGLVVLVSFERVPAAVQAEPSSIVVHAG
jgi:hypothetical protein